MKRDMDLVRQILLFTEAKTNPYDLTMPEFEGHEQNVVSYHVRLLEDRGFLSAHNLTGMGSSDTMIPRELSWEGHEFLDAVRKDPVWTKVKAKIAEKGGDMPFELVKELAMTLAKEYFRS